jgi:hypothetical protein
VAGFLSEMLLRLGLQALALRPFSFRGSAEKVRRHHDSGSPFFTSDLNEVRLTQIGQLNVVTVIQKRSRVRADAEAQWARKGARQAYQRKVVRAPEVGSVRWFHLQHARQVINTPYIATADVDEEATAIIVDGLHVVALTVAPDPDDGLGLRQEELLGRMERVTEIP